MDLLLLMEKISILPSKEQVTLEIQVLKVNKVFKDQQVLME
jgi:hypothetical protein